MKLRLINNDMTDQPENCLTPHDVVETIATVSAVSAQWAELVAERKSACGACSQNTSCGTASLAGYFGNGQASLRIRNDFDAITGEKIVIGLPGATLIKASILAYLVPLAGLLAGAIAGNSLGFGEGGSALCGIAGLGLGFVFSRKIMLNRNNPERFSPVFLRRAKAGE